MSDGHGFKFRVPKTYNVVFVNASLQEVGTLDFGGGSLKFSGDAEESATLFLENLSSKYVGMTRELAEARAERDALKGLVASNENARRLLCEDLAREKEEAIKAEAECERLREALFFAGIYFAVLFAASAVVLYMADKDSLCAAAVALAGVCAGVAIGAESVRRGCG